MPRKTKGNAKSLRLKDCWRQNGSDSAGEGNY